MEELTDGQILLLLERIENEKIEPHHTAYSLHVSESRYMIDNSEYVFYYALSAKEGILPMVEKIIEA